MPSGTTTCERRVEVVPPECHHAFCGVALDALGPRALVDTMAGAIQGERRMIIGHHNLHGLSLLGDAGFRAFFDVADASFVDGMSMVMLGRLAGHRIERDDRATVLDWIWLLFEHAERHGWRILHLGSHDDAIARARTAIMQVHPHLDLVCVSGFFDATPGSADNERVLQTIADARPHVLLVGMGMPRQERWIVENLDRLPDGVIVTVGGIFGYLGGEQATPPRWTGRLGLEWLYRLLTQPRRLGRRYLVEPIPLLPRLVGGVARERLRQANARMHHRAA